MKTISELLEDRAWGCSVLYRAGFNECKEILLPLVEALEKAKLTFKNCVPNSEAYQTDLILTEALKELRAKLEGKDD